MRQDKVAHSFCLNAYLLTQLLVECFVTEQFSKMVKPLL